ncbi:MAG: glycoside hydrolase family 95 protein [Roseiflexaceae bacterium]
MSSLWYRQPAREWVEALPIGNGHIGAMVFGDPHHERIALNHDTFWSGQPRTGQHPDRSPAVQTIRTMLDNGDMRTAEQYAEKHLTGSWTQSYLPVADLLLTYHSSAAISDYTRTLDLDTATIDVRYRRGDADYRQQAFASYPDNVIVLSIQSDEPTINLDVTLRSHYTQSCVAANRDVVLHAVAPLHVEPNYVNSNESIQGIGQGMRATTLVRIIESNGALDPKNDTLHIRNASHITLLIGIATSFVAFDQPSTADANAKVRAIIDAAESRHAQLWQTHLHDYQPLFARMQLQLTPSRDDLPTDERLLRLASDAPSSHEHAIRYQATDRQKHPMIILEDDIGLVGLLLDMGRYLLISSSRPSSQAANLQGIWNDNPRPPWSSNYTININTQMNYWAALTTNLVECQQPLTQLIRNLQVDGQRVAQSYGARGWTAHHNTDIWAPANAVKGKAVWFLWPFAASWLSLHLYEEVLFTQNDDFARHTALPIMRDAAEFIIDWLQPQPDGTLQSSPSTSPENLFVAPDGLPCAISIGSESDISMARALFVATLDLAAQIGISGESWCDDIRQTLAKLPAPLIDRSGRLKEWRHDLTEAERGHRHISHLYGVYPAEQITPWQTPALADAVRQSLTQRLAHGSGHTGWSAAWFACCFARLHDGQMALEILYRLLRDSTYPNMLGAHPPFQIDGSLGAPAAITEMLLQSHGNRLSILPALPQQWPNGHVKGLCARGGLTVDITWHAGRVVTCTIHAIRETTITLHLPHMMRQGTIAHTEISQLHLLPNSTIILQG